MFEKLYRLTNEVKDVYESLYPFSKLSPVLYVDKETEEEIDKFVKEVNIVKYEFRLDETSNSHFDEYYLGCFNGVDIKSLEAKKND